MKNKIRNRLIEYTLPFNDPDRVPINRNKLGPMVEAYVTCALWSSCEDEVFGSGESLDKNYTKYNISEATLAQMIRDCVHFYWRNRKTLEEIYEGGFYDESDMGHDLWLSRNGYGAGFFSRGSDPIWDELQESAQGFGEFTLWVDGNNEVSALWDMSKL